MCLKLTEAGIAAKSIQDKKLYETTVKHRYLFSKVAEVNYNYHHPESINPIPPASVIEDRRLDYAVMKDEMIYEKNPPQFQDLIENLLAFKANLSGIKWNYELSFPVKK